MPFLVSTVEQDTAADTMVRAGGSVTAVDEADVKGEDGSGEAARDGRSDGVNEGHREDRTVEKSREHPDGDRNSIAL